MTIPKDYYGILGVKRDATQKDIQSAYRKMAKEHHPDSTGGDPESEAKFKEASEAYEVLSDQERRAAYDNPGIYGGNLNSVFGDMFGFMFNHNTANFRYGPMPNIHIRISLSMGEAYEGTEKTIRFDRTLYCGDCKGSGMIQTSSADKKCPVCNGTGCRYGVGRTPCQACGGTGKSGMKICDKCNWKGYTTELADITITIPPRILRGAVFRIEGQGNLDSTGTKGFVDVECVYPMMEGGYSIDGHGNISCAMAVPWSSVLMDREEHLKVFGIEDVVIKLDGNLGSGSVYRFKGRGMGSSDLMVSVVHHVPENMSEEDRKSIASVLEKYDDSKTRG